MRSEAASPDPFTGKLTGLTGREPEELLVPITRPSNPAPAVSLLPPRVVPAEKTLERRMSSTQLSIEEQIQRLRGANGRFQRITVEVRGTTLSVNGTSAEGEAMMAFAQQLSRIPGITSVVLETKRSPR
jgi:hypothetical protein